MDHEPYSPKTLRVTVDKNHLIAIGERLYAESIELIRELVNNAYDADATVVRVTLEQDRVSVEDDGSGMDEHGLEQYFTIGSRQKKTHGRSPRYNRTRIGEFGIGKFSTLTACRRFEVRTQKDAFAAVVVFDKTAWESDSDRWHLPLLQEPPDPARPDGTRVTLSELTKSFDADEVHRRLMESTPVKAPHFSVFVNGRRVLSREIAGHRIGVMEGCAYGPVTGEIVLLTGPRPDDLPPGIECKVKQAMIRRETLGLESLGPELLRVAGEVNADFLPITSDRSGFVEDSEEYRAFRALMKRFLAQQVAPRLQDLSSRKEKQKVRRALNDVLRRLQEALTAFPELNPYGGLPQAPPKGEASPREEAKKGTHKPRGKKKAKLKPLSATAVSKRLKLGGMGVSIYMDHFGASAPECYTEGRIIYINQDHPLYVQESKNKETQRMHLGRLITQEISLVKNPRRPRQAFEWQSRLLTAAFAKDKRDAPSLPTPPDGDLPPSPAVPILTS